jgi:ferredoxin
MLSDSQLKKLRKPHVNSTCIGCSACTAISSQVFELDDEGLSRVKSCETYEWHDVDDSIAACPVNAISWQPTDESGNYLNGVEEHRDVA